MTPLRKMTGWAGWQLVRRQLGLLSFTAGCLHVLAYLFFLLGWQWGALCARAGAATLHRGWRASLDAPVAAGTHFNTG